MSSLSYKWHGSIINSHHNRLISIFSLSDLCRMSGNVIFSTHWYVRAANGERKDGALSIGGKTRILATPHQSPVGIPGVDRLQSFMIKSKFGNGIGHGAFSVCFWMGDEWEGPRSTGSSCMCFVEKYVVLIIWYWTWQRIKCGIVPFRLESDEWKWKFHFNWTFMALLGNDASRIIGAQASAEI